MNIIKFLKIISNKLLYVLLIPTVASTIVFFLTKDLPVKYTTFSTIYSGVTSNSGLAVEALRVDNVATQNEYNNLMTILKSNSLFEDVSLHLLTQHLLLTKPEKEIISIKAYNEFINSVPDEVKKLVVKGNFEKTYSNLKKYIKEDENNYIYRLMNFGNKYYSKQAISNVKGERLTNSDLIKISYESEDAGICYNTVKFTTELFVKRYSTLKVSQSNSTVAYFENQLKEAALKLNGAEQKLLDFNIDNDIINYYEQTEQVTTQQEKIEVKLQEVKMEYEAAQAVLIKLEREIETRYKINIRNTEVLRIREKLVDYNNAITAIEIDENSTNAKQLLDLKSKRNEVLEKLENKVDSIYIYENKSQGIESQRLLSEWLDAVKTQENYNALFKSMKDRQIEFMKQFKRYAPLGATIKRIEREIHVFEREYLSILQDLGMARQNQQNMDMRSDMKVFDDTQFPINAIASKKNLYVTVAAMFSLIFFLLAVFIIELMDKRIKTPSLLHQLTGLNVVGAFCKENKKKFINTEMIEQRAALMIFEKMRQLGSESPRPFVVQIFSSWDNAGNLFIAKYLSAEIERHNFTVKVLNFEPEISIDGVIAKSLDNEGVTDLEAMNLQDKINQFDTYIELFNAENIVSDFVISVLSPVSNGIDNPVLIANVKANFIVYDASALWSEADNFILDKLKNAVPNGLFAILTKAEPDNLEEIYGEIPKKRSFIRKLLKKLLKRVIK